MNRNAPIYTVLTECHDCYKCVRHCPCKAIKVENGRASVIPELCVSCGTCVRVCPAGAKHIRNDAAQVKFHLAEPEPVYASIAPSYVSYYRHVAPEKFAAALRKLGFAGVSETALGAQLVSSKTGEFLKKAENGIYLSSACPAINSYVRFYLPDYAKTITPVLSPLLTHCKYLKSKFGEQIKVVFIGPCAAKKLEADAHPELLAAAITFERLDIMLEQAQIEFDKVEITEADRFFPVSAEEGRLYPFEGGMNDTIRGEGVEHVNFMAVSGLHNLERLLTPKALLCREAGESVTFIECLACDGGCVNGPVMRNEGRSLEGMLAATQDAKKKNSLGRKVEFQINENYFAKAEIAPKFADALLHDALAQVGKISREDELNCGGCGYATCRDFAVALLSGKAETSMCLSYLRKLAQKKSNALIQHIPAGVVIADMNLKIVECNETFAKMSDESTVLAYEASPGLPGVELTNVVNFIELFEIALSSGADVIRNNYIQGEQIFNISIFNIESKRIVGAVIQDVTMMELHREQISERAKEVIHKNVITVQQIAKCLGEHMAETEVLLREVAQGYSKPSIKPGSDHAK